MVSEPTEEEKQLAEQAKEYGKMRQQSVLGEEEEAESEEPPPPGNDPFTYCSVNQVSACIIYLYVKIVFY